MRRQIGSVIDELMPSDVELDQLLDKSKSPESKVLDAEEHNLLHQAVLLLPATLQLSPCFTIWKN